MDVSAEAGLAARVAGLVREVAGAGVQAEVFVLHTAEALTRFANSAIHQNVADATTLVRLRLHLDGRTAAGSTTVLDRDALLALVERTVAAAGVCPPDPGWPGLAPPAEVGGPADWDDDAAAGETAAGRATRVRAFVDAAGGLQTAGYCRSTYRSGAFANTAGQSAQGRTAEVAMDAIARCDGADGVARLSTARPTELDGAALGARAAAKARAGARPVELPPGRYEVVLEPTAVGDILQNLAFHGFNGKAHTERRSFAELGAAQFDQAVTIVDDPLAAPGLGLTFDAEGTPKHPLALVDAGVTRAVCHDRRTAAVAGTASTGHAVAGGGAWGAMPVNLGLLPAVPDAAAAGAPPHPVTDAATAPLLAGLERGLLVTDLWYTRVLDPRSLVVTGLTRNGVWLVEGGEVTTAVRNLRFTQSYPQALGPGAVRALGSSATTLPQAWGTSWWSAPPLALRSWNFTGGASG